MNQIKPLDYHVFAALSRQLVTERGNRVLRSHEIIIFPHGNIVSSLCIQFNSDKEHQLLGSG